MVKVKFYVNSNKTFKQVISLSKGNKKENRTFNLFALFNYKTKNDN